MLTGIEVDILDDGALDQDPDLLAELDVVVASVHSKLRMPRAGDDRADADARSRTRTSTCSATAPAGWSRAAASARSRSSTPTDGVRRLRRVNGVAVEINSRPERLDPPKRLLRLAVEAGCEFTIDTDAHAPGQLDWLGNGCERAVACEVPAERVRNTWPVERLLTTRA